jgi:putative two-component system response regulator
VAVADVYDALTHERPYKSAWTVSRAIAEVLSKRGSHFDPLVVDALLRVLARQEQRPAA